MTSKEFEKLSRAEQLERFEKHKKSGQCWNTEPLKAAKEPDQKPPAASYFICFCFKSQ